MKREAGDMVEEENRHSGPDSIWNKNFICVLTGNFMLCLAHFSVNPLVATYAEFLEADPRVIGLLAGMFFGVALAMRPFAGPVTTKIDKRKLLIFAFILGAVSNLGYALLPNIPAFVVFRVIHGVQFSLVGLVLMTLAGDHLPKSKMISGMGIYGIGAAVASAIAPSIGDGLVRLGGALRGEAFGFTLMFLFGALVFLLAIIPAALIAPDKKTKAEIASAGVWYKNIFSVHAIPATIVMFLIMMPHAMIQTYMFDFGREQGIDGISVFYLVLALTLAVSRPLCGILNDRFGVAKIMLPGFVIFAGAQFVVGSSNTLWMALIGAVMFAFGFGATHPSLQGMCLQMETSVKRSVASNTLYIGMDLGLFLGPVLGGVVRVQTDFAVMYKVSAIPIIIAIIIFIIIMPIYNRRIKALKDPAIKECS